MKKLLVILLSVFLFGCSENGVRIWEENDLTKKNIKGKVKKLTEAHFDAKEAFGETQKDILSYTFETQFNKEGNKTEAIEYNKDGEL